MRRRTAPLPARSHFSLMQRFGWPLSIAIASLTGLILGLTGNGWRDTLAVALLIMPIAAMIFGWWRRS